MNNKPHKTRTKDIFDLNFFFFIVTCSLSSTCEELRMCTPHSVTVRSRQTVQNAFIRIFLEDVHISTTEREPNNSWRVQGSHSVATCLHHFLLTIKMQLFVQI